MRNRALITASLALVAFGGTTTAAAATTMKYVTSGTVPSGTSIAGGLKAGTSSVLNGGAAGNIGCTWSSFTASMGTNPSAGAVSGSPTSWTSSGCGDTIPLVSVSSVSMRANSVTATYLGAVSTFAVSGLVVTVTFSDGKTCVYSPTTEPATAQHNPHTSPWNAEYTFTAVPLTKRAESTSFACAPYVTWSATYIITSGGIGITIQP